MLEHLDINRLRLMTDNPRKVQELEEPGIEVVERLPFKMPHSPSNQKYFATKAGKLGHLIG